MCCFLFLPAAFTPTTAYYWTLSAGSLVGTSSIGWWLSTQRPANQLKPRSIGFSIRLASRLGLFDCSVDGVCLLFLPAGSSGHYWSINRSTRETSGWAYKVDICQVVNYAGLTGKRAIRLASR